MKMLDKGFSWKIVAAIAFVVLCLELLTGCAIAKHEIDNPYSGVDWANWEQYRANLHTHTTQSDGRLTPAEAIDEYRRRGYAILAITDHNRFTWPWMDFGRDPEELGMIAVKGNELSRFHHTGSYFIDYETDLMDIDEALAELGELGGLAVLFHPGRYDYPVEWYVERYMKYPHLVGLEVHNQGDRYRDDRAMWDRVLTEMMPERPVWGFANDDMHSLNHCELSWNVFPLSELTVEEIREGMETGRFYFSYINRGAQGATPAPTITKIIVDEKRGFIEIEHENVENVQWIANGIVVHDDSRLQLADIQEDASYVRANLIGPGGITYTNPFGIRRKER